MEAVQDGTTTGVKRKRVLAAPTILHANATGTVKWYSYAMGYGYIDCTEGGEYTGKKVHVRYTDVKRMLGHPSKSDLIEGQHVRFNIVQGPEGPKAHQVELIDRQ
jgi:cold shock protein